MLVCSFPVQHSHEPNLAKPYEVQQLQQLLLLRIRDMPGPHGPPCKCGVTAGQLRTTRTCWMVSLAQTQLICHVSCVRLYLAQARSSFGSASSKLDLYSILGQADSLQLFTEYLLQLN
jgi:hypothetical protein